MISIKTKLLTTLLVLSLIPFAIISLISYINSDEALSSRAFDQMKSVREVKKRQIETYFSERKKNMAVLLETVESLLQAAYAKINTVQENKIAAVHAYLQKSLVDAAVISNSYAASRALRDFSSVYNDKGIMDEALYDFFEKVKYENSLKQFKKEYGYYDLLLITLKGDVVFSSNRDSDLGQNVLRGPLQYTGLNRCFQKALIKTHVEDFSGYPPSHNRHISFVGSPIKEHEGEIIGVVVLKMDTQTINSVVHRHAGMGESGETYLVGLTEKAARLRSIQRIKSGATGSRITDPNLPSAKSGPVGPMIIRGESGSMEIRRYDPLRLAGLNWVMVTSIALEEAIAPQLSPDVDFFGKFIMTYGFSDLLLLTPNGNVFYSVTHSPDYATNVFDPPQNTYALRRLLDKVLRSKDFEFEDFGMYPPETSEPYAFIAQPVLQGGKVEMIVVLRMPITRINDIMLKRDGMGDTGKTYLVGPDCRMRSDSFLDRKNFSVKASFTKGGKGKVDTDSVKEALKGYTGQMRTQDYRNVDVLSAYAPIDVWDVRWALIAEMDREEAFAATQSLTSMALAIAGAFVLIISMLSLLMARHFAEPIAKLTRGAKAISQHNFEVSVAVDSNDELQELAGAFNTMVVEINRYANNLQQKVEELGKAESELRQSEFQMRQLADATWEGILIHKDGVIIHVNRQFVEMFGYSASELTDRQLFSFLVHEDQIEALKKHVAKEYLGPYESVLLDKEGGSIPVEIRARMMDYRGRRVRVAAIRDLSDQKKAEEEKARLEMQLRQMQKMEALGTLAGGIAHDFNNILAVIMGYGELALDMGGKGHPNVGEISQIISAAQRGRDLVTQILSFSRKIEPQLKTLELNREIERTSAMLRSTLPKMVQIETYLDQSLHPVKADASMISQVLINLATNAADAMPDGGRLIFQTRNIHLEDDIGHKHLEIRPGDYVQLEVSDTGIGMDEKTRQKIFDPFFTTKEVGKGTGLGLSTAFGIIKGHNGHLHCYSEPGVGTTFRIFLPAVINKADDHKAEPESKPDISGGNEIILMVDDEKILRMMGSGLLSQAGYQVIEASTGEEALEIYAGKLGEIDLVLLDLSMPGMGGHKCLEKILAVDPKAKVIIASGYSAKGSAAECLEMGALDFISKPFSRFDLLAVVREALDKRV